MRSIRLTFLCTAVALCVISCSEERFLAFDDVVYVKDFPVRYTPDKPDTLDIDAINIQGIEVFDELILISCHDSCGCLSAFGKDGKKISSSFLKTGRGPGEILYNPFMSWLDFDRNPDGHIMAGMFDYKGNYIEYDVTGTLESGIPKWRCVSDSHPISFGARYFKIDDDNLICRRRNANDNGYERFVENSAGEHYRNSAMEYLNSVTSPEINLLSTLFLVNKEKSLVAELGSRLNEINLYSLKSDFKTTIALGNSLENLPELEMKPEGEMSKTYYEAKSYDDFFVGLYLGTTLDDLDEGRFLEPELHFFSWDGKPLAEISLPVRSLFFDIDLTDGRLYVVDYETEKILRYDISEALNSSVFTRDLIYGVKAKRGTVN